MHKQTYLIRHGETEWSLSGRHTGITDIPLTKNGQMQAKTVGKRLSDHPFEAIFTSPLQRALHTCELSGLSKKAEVDPDLIEWNYGDFEGLTTEEIRKKQPDWTIFSDGAPHGESVADISTRAIRMLAKIHSFQGDVALFSHGHFLRVLAVMWLHLPAYDGKLFSLFPSSISILGYEHSNAVLISWNDTAHLLSHPTNRS